MVSKTEEANKQKLGIFRTAIIAHKLRSSLKSRKEIAQTECSVARMRSVMVLPTNKNLVVLTLQSRQS